MDELVELVVNKADPKSSFLLLSVVCVEDVTLFWALFDASDASVRVLPFELFSFELLNDSLLLLEEVLLLFSDVLLVEVSFAKEFVLLFFSSDVLVSLLLSLFDVFPEFFSICFSEEATSDLGASCSEVDVVLVDELALDASLLEVVSTESLLLVLSTVLLLVDSVDSEVSDLVIAVDC
ncbi:hypothetical protein [Staphylococcus borealis]|uniref:hypothetical protein n=1 Tax=Staphylococcus borealis TaxID=2742203 RepID=UPI000D1F0E0A|nr:hypothetical protein [Staphylococcus borealis]MCQ9279411.1 hypothetical protein [Staphylococcus borealis]PTK67656.1 hypothetical protein BUZ28_02400 [Staphylococcus borealis]